MHTFPKAIRWMALPLFAMLAILAFVAQVAIGITAVQAWNAPLVLILCFGTSMWAAMLMAMSVRTLTSLVSATPPLDLFLIHTQVAWACGIVATGAVLLIHAVLTAACITTPIPTITPLPSPTITPLALVVVGIGLITMGIVWHARVSALLARIHASIAVRAATPQEVHT